MESPRTAVLIVIACAVSACTEETSRWVGTVSDSSGVTIVTNTEQGLWAPGEEWGFEQELSIGQADGPPEYQFGEIGGGGVAVDSNGRVFVLDGHAEHIQVYSPEGAYELTIGARGSGPGELQTGLCVLMGPGDTVLVPDFQNRRFNRYSPEGSVLTGTNMDLNRGWPIRFRSTPSGLMAEQVRQAQVPGEPAPENRIDALVRLATDGAVTDTLLTFPSGEFLSLDGQSRFYAPEPAWDLTGEGLVVLGRNDEYRIGIYSEGRLTRIIAKPFEHRPVSQEEEQAVWEHLEQRWREMGIPPPAWPQIRNNIHFAAYLPAFHSLMAGPLGTIWVQHALPATEMDETQFPGEDGAPDWDVFDAEGRFLGVVRMPARFTPVVFRRGRLYGVSWDDLGVQYAVRLRLVGAELEARG